MVRLMAESGVTMPRDMKIDILEIDAALVRETEALAEVTAQTGQRRLWLWQAKTRCLVAPKKLSSLPGFAASAEALAACGWPVHLRSTGGDVTPQGPGVVNVSHLYTSPPTKRFDLDEEYGRLCAPIEVALGAGASRGWLPGAFCDGAHNVQWHGKKFAGTAMRFRPHQTDKARYAVLAHALMLIAPPEPEAINALNLFLAGLGQPRVIHANVHTGLPKSVSVDAFIERLVHAFATAHPDPFTPRPTHR